MIVGDYSKRSISNYLREIRVIAEYYPEKSVSDLSQLEVDWWNVLYLKQSLNLLVNEFLRINAGYQEKIPSQKRTNLFSGPIDSGHDRNQAVLLN
ncbi:hypothetical protein MASR2M44_01800 [Bacteroidota bacterium]